jgi:hypothetical protein
MVSAPTQSATRSEWRIVMFIAVVEFIPYIAFLGAAALLGWVAIDLGIRHVRKKGLAPMLARLSLRGLASKPEPMSDPAVRPLSEPTPKAEQPVDVVVPAKAEVEDDVQVPTSMAEVFDPDFDPTEPAPAIKAVPEAKAEPEEPKAEEAPDEAVAETEVQVKEEAVEEAFEEEPAEETVKTAAQTVESSHDTEDDGDPSDDDVVYTDVLSVRRDSSVRVYDTSVAASERKAAAS